MNQENIREFGNQEYTLEEGARLIKELNNRTSHNIDGFNSIEEVGTKLKEIHDFKPRPTTVYNGKRVFFTKHPDNDDPANQNILEEFDFLENLPWSSELIITFGQYLGGDKSDLNNIDQLTFTIINPII